MPDVFSDIMKASPDVLEAIVNVLEMRAADPQLQAMLESYLSEIELPDSAQILEVGSGTAFLRLSPPAGEDRIPGS